MELTFQYWFMLPVAVAVATTAMASGVGGATFFAPIMILALRFPPERQAVRIIEGESSADIAAELVKVLHEESKVI